jgi:hypothetical protein
MGSENNALLPMPPPLRFGALSPGLRVLLSAFIRVNMRFR